MAAFYRDPPRSYYQISDAAGQHYNPGEMPFHCDLIGRVAPGMSILEFGCGTAHLCPQVEKRGGIYTGVDYSEALLLDNRRRYPNARFFQIATPPVGEFDIVASLYTIEHIVDPPAYLERLWRYCRPGGLVAIICPEFVECPDFPPSFFYGKTPRRLRAKFQSLSLFDVWLHLVDLKVNGARWKKNALAAPPGAFWINLQPRILHGAEYSIDADAVHLVQRRDLAWFFEQKSATIVLTSAGMNGVSASVLRYNCYVLARKSPTGLSLTVSSG